MLDVVANAPRESRQERLRDIGVQLRRGAEAAVEANNRLRVRLSADYERLEFLRVLRTSAPPSISGTGDLLVPDAPASTQNVKALQDG